MDVFVLLFKDGNVYGASKPMNSKEAEAIYKEAKSYGYEVIKICVNNMFESANIVKKYMKDVII